MKLAIQQYTKFLVAKYTGNLNWNEFEGEMRSLYVDEYVHERELIDTNR